MSLPRYPNYKDSGVEWLGEVPGYWTVTKTKHVLQFTTGWTPPTGDSASFEGENLWANISDLGPKWIGETAKRVSDLAINTARIAMSPKGSLLFSFKLSIGQVSFAAQDMYTNEAIATFLPSPGIDLSYAYYVFPLFLVQNASVNIYGAKLLNQELIRSASFAIPPLPEQTQIAAFLDRETAKIDELVAEQRRLMALLKEKRQAVISHAVTRGLNPDAPLKPSGNQWLGAVPTHWGVKCLKHIKAEEKNAFVDGPFGSNLKSEHFIDDGDAYVIESGFATQGKLESAELKTITLEHFNTICRSEARSGDIIIAKIGAQFGKSSILPDLDKRAVVSGNSLKLTINQQSCDVEFVNWHLVNIKALGVMDDIVNATAQPALSLGEMNNLPMLVPPRDEQVEIVRFLKERLGELDTLNTEAQRAIDLLQERRTALISAAVTGQIDVRGAVAA